MRISQVQIAGAGAGKTYGLAELICNEQIKEGKNIYAITYTNYAKRNIEEKVLEKKGYIPDNIKISTVHTFLLNEVIYPYSRFLLKKRLNTATSILLPDEPRRKNSIMSKLEDIGIIHNEKVFKMAKQILVGSKTQTKTEKQRRNLVLNHFIASIDSIYIDEVQDLNQDIIDIIKVLVKAGIYIYMVGDPKQALREPEIFKNLIEEVKNRSIENIELLPINNFTRRLPKEIVNITNLYCPTDQKQESKSEEKGSVFYTYTSEDGFDKIFNEIKNKNGLIYARKKDDVFDTQKEKSIIPQILKEKLLEQIKIGDDEDAFLYEKEKELEKILTKNKNIKKEFLDKYKIGKLPLEDFTQLINQTKKERIKYVVNSIDKAKGLENENCMFILNKSMLDYLLMTKKEENKELNYLYVALTRTKKNLILAINANENVDKELEKLGIKRWEEK